MEFRILGALELSGDDGAPLDVGRGKQRSLLAILILHANEVVSSDRLAEELWRGTPPATAPKALQVHVSQLRKLLGPGVLDTRSPGYVLRVEDGRLDSRAFEALVEDAASDGPQAAVDGLTRALALWRGPALADVAYEPFAQAEAARLEELRLTAIERRADGLLALGRHAEAIGDLQALVAREPLRERPRAQLITALYRTGRQADALEAYRAACDDLMELGLEPTAELRELQRAVLNQDPSLAAPVKPPPAAAPGSAPETAGGGFFVGRDPELERLCARLDAACAGRGGLVLVGGEPGIGKSRLLSRLAEHAEERGARALWGRAWEAGGAPAYWPWIQVLRGLAGDSLDELVPGLAKPSAASDSDGARILLFDAATTFLTRAAEAQPLILLLDDVHAADAPSLLLLQFVARQLPDARILVVAAYRDVAGGPGAALSSAFAELAGEPGMERISLGGLDRAEVARYIDLAAAVRAPAPVVTRIHADTSGNPLFVAELVRLLESEGRLEAAAGSHAALPEGVHDVIGRRLNRLSDGCVELLTLASVLGRRFSLDALESLADMPADRLLDLLDEATEARVLAELPGPSPRLQFSHALVRDSLYDRLASGRRARLHRAAGEALERLYALDPGPHLAELALHFAEAARRGDATKGVEYARRAGDRAAALLAFEEAVRLYELALRSLDLAATDDSLDRCELLLARGEVLMRAGESDGAKSVFRVAAELARALRRPELLARAALGYGGRLLWGRAISDPALVPLLEEALSQLGAQSGELRARLLGRLAAALRDEPSRARRSALAEEAVSIARRVGDPATLAYALETHWEATESADTAASGAAQLSELLELAERTGDRERQFIAHESSLAVSLQFGEMSSVRVHLAAMAAIAGELRQPAHEWLLATYRAMVALLHGELDRAEEAIEDAHERGRRAQMWNAVVSYRVQTFALRQEQGRAGELAELLERSVHEYPSLIRFKCMLASVRAELGQPEEARAIHRRLVRDDLDQWHLGAEWLVTVALLGDTAASLGDSSQVGVVHRVLSPYAEHNAVALAEISTGAVARVLGRLAGALGRWDEAERHFRFALAMNERIGALPFAAHTKHDHARMLLERRGAGDAARAGALLEEATATYDALGMRVWSERAAALRPEVTRT
jgi:DNA-binding SARP family transcriptional activator